MYLVIITNVGILRYKCFVMRDSKTIPKYQNQYAQPYNTNNTITVKAKANISSSVTGEQNIRLDKLVIH